MLFSIRKLNEKGEKKHARKKENVRVLLLLLLLCTSFFLSFSISKRVTIIFSLTCREEDDGTDCSFPPASAFSFSFSSSLRWRRIRER